MMTYSAPKKPGRNRSAQSYANIGLETKVLSATPEQLITMLFDAAEVAIAQAQMHLENNNQPGRGAAISKAIDIVDSGLKASLNMEAGGELATNLSHTYDLIIQNLLLANLHADAEKLQLAQQLVNDIAGAWRTATQPAPKETTQKESSPV